MLFEEADESSASCTLLFHFPCHFFLSLSVWSYLYTFFFDSQVQSGEYRADKEKKSQEVFK